jgi:hypothetical protein
MPVQRISEDQHKQKQCHADHGAGHRRIERMCHSFTDQLAEKKKPEADEHGLLSLLAA